MENPLGVNQEPGQDAEREKYYKTIETARLAFAQTAKKWGIEEPEALAQLPSDQNFWRMHWKRLSLLGEKPEEAQEAVCGNLAKAIKNLGQEDARVQSLKRLLGLKETDEMDLQDLIDLTSGRPTRKQVFEEEEKRRAEAEARREAERREAEERRTRAEEERRRREQETQERQRRRQEQTARREGWQTGAEQFWRNFWNRQVLASPVARRSGFETGIGRLLYQAGQNVTVDRIRTEAREMVKGLALNPGAGLRPLGKASWDDFVFSIKDLDAQRLVLEAISPTRKNIPSFPPASQAEKERLSKLRKKISNAIHPDKLSREDPAIKELINPLYTWFNSTAESLLRNNNRTRT